jgi:hypothetical protein
MFTYTSAVEVGVAVVARGAVTAVPGTIGDIIALTVFRSAALQLPTFLTAQSSMTGMAKSSVRLGMMGFLSNHSVSTRKT